MNIQRYCWSAWEKCTFWWVHLVQELHSQQVREARAEGGMNRYLILISWSGSRAHFWVSGQPMLTWSSWKFKWFPLVRKGRQRFRCRSNQVHKLPLSEVANKIGYIGKGAGRSLVVNSQQLCEWPEPPLAPSWAGTGWTIRLLILDFK